MYIYIYICILHIHHELYTIHNILYTIHYVLYAIYPADYYSIILSKLKTQYHHQITELCCKLDSIDIDTTKIDIFNKERSNAGVAQDASTVDFDDLLSQYDDNHVDYLQIDIDNLQATHSVLDGIDFDKFDFSVITFEHDLYRNGIALKMRMKTLMNEKGYVLVSEDVCNTSLEYPYEDWYVNPKYVKEEDWKKYECKTKLDTNIFFG